ncbi:MAG: helix-hairpin-helix domain-containing protein [Clostridia bacterium]
MRWDSQIQSLLDQIPGIGPKRRASLLQTFGSVEKIRSLSSEELMKADGINQKAADAIFQFFHQPSDPPAASEIPDNQ